MAQYFQGFSLGAGSVKTYHLDIDNDLSFNNHKLTNLGNPTNDTDASRKQDIVDMQKWKVVYETTLSSNVNNVTISGLDINTDKIYKLFINLRNSADTYTDFYLVVNGDGNATNYYSQNLVVNGTTISANSQTNSARFGYIPYQANATFEINIMKDTSGHFRALSLENYSNVIIYLSTIYKNDTITNITSLSIYGVLSNALGAGTHILLTKLRG